VVAVNNRAWSSREERLGDASDYESLVCRTPQATVFHTSNWLQAVDAVTPGGLRFLRVLQGGETVGVLPHSHLRRGPFRLTFSPPPRLGMQYLGPLIPGWTEMKQGKREQRLTAIAEALEVHLRKTRNRYCQIRWAPGFDDARAFQWNGFDALPRYIYVLSLSDESSVWESLGRNVRSSIRRHMSNIPVAPGTSEDWPIFEQRLATRYSEQGLDRALPVGYVEALRKSLGDALTLLVARREEDWLGAVALIHSRDRVILWQGAFKGPAEPAVNDVLVWNAIRHACATGAEEFELMGANTRRIAEFKAKFNPQLETYLEMSKGTRLASAALKLRGMVRSGGW